MGRINKFYIRPEFFYFLVLGSADPNFWKSRMCVYSNSRNDVPRVAQRYGTIAAHTRRRASVLVVFVVFCVHVHSFAGLIRRTPPPTFSDTAITDRHSDTTIFQLRAHWVRISWSIGSDKNKIGFKEFYFYSFRRSPNAFDKQNKSPDDFLRVTRSACTNGRFGRIYVRKFLSYAEKRHQRRPRTSKIVSVRRDLKRHVVYSNQFQND